MCRVAPRCGGPPAARRRGRRGAQTAGRGRGHADASLAVRVPPADADFRRPHQIPVPDVHHRVFSTNNGRAAAAGEVYLRRHQPRGVRSWQCVAQTIFYFQTRFGETSHISFVSPVDAEIAYAIGLQEGLGLDVLVHGEAERTDMARNPTKLP